jgi:23S rRNA pseudouridine1911/1915/1917 synthase
VGEGRVFTAGDVPERLDVFLTRHLGTLSRSAVQRLIKEGAVTVAGRAVPARARLIPGEKVRVLLPDFDISAAAPDGGIPILFEDADLLVINKPAGLVVHPAGPHREGTVVQRLWPKLSKGWADSKPLAAGGARPGVVHRLDRGTSGVMVIAKTPAAAENLSGQFARREVEKVYWALVRGIPKGERGTIQSPIGRSRRSPHRMSSTDTGRWSATDFTVLKTFPHAPEGPLALIEARPRTGRTHQIRVHLAALGHPILGDALYGAPADRESPQLFLHALSLSLRHPRTEKWTVWKTPPPPNFLEKPT